MISLEYFKRERDMWGGGGVAYISWGIKVITKKTKKQETGRFYLQTGPTFNITIGTDKMQFVKGGLFDMLTPSFLLRLVKCNYSIFEGFNIVCIVFLKTIQFLFNCLLKITW